MIKILKNYLYILLPREQKLALLLLFMTLITILMEIAGILSVLPFLFVLTDPSIIETNRIFKTVFEISLNFGIKTNQQFLIFLGAVILILLSIS